MAMKVRYTVVNGEVLSENRGGVKRDYLPDTQGNTIGLIDSTQTITDTFSYYPYGEVASRTGTTTTPFQFLGTLGYYRDSASRTYVRARTLNTAQGRWMTQDPIGFKGGDINLYRYVANRPTVLTDPSGLLVSICHRPTVGSLSNAMFSHWFIQTTVCGAVGYTKSNNPKGGTVWGTDANAAGFMSPLLECHATNVNLDQENCMCVLAKNADTGGILGWPMCGRIWSGTNYGLNSQNCQDYVTCLFCKCTGLQTGLPMWTGIDWKTDCPKYKFTGSNEVYKGGYHG